MQHTSNLLWSKFLFYIPVFLTNVIQYKLDSLSNIKWDRDNLWKTDEQTERKKDKMAFVRTRHVSWNLDKVRGLEFRYGR